MLSKHFFRIYRWRAKIFKYSYCAFIQWDYKKDRLVVNDSIYTLMNNLRQMGYLVFLSTMTTIMVCIYAFEEIRNGKQDIFYVAYKPKVRQMESLMHLIYVMYVGACVLIAVCWGRAMYKRHEFVQLLNLIFDYGEKCRGKKL